MKTCVFFLLIFILLSCHEMNKKKLPNKHITKSSIKKPINKKSTNPKPLPISDTSFSLKYKNRLFKTDIKFPPDSVAIKGTIVALHGWNLAYTDWCTKTTLCEKALKNGYVLIIPQMGKSTYSNFYYPQTRKNWAVYPTRKWLNDTLLNHLQKEFNLLIEGQQNYILGLSTGGKGAALIALDNPRIFKAAAALSGDFDQTLFPKNNFYIGFYGEYEKFKKRWHENDNLIFSIKNYIVPTYLGHGLKDKVVPIVQSKVFYTYLIESKPTLDFVFHIDSTAKHDYNYWNSEVNNILDFFKKH